MGRAERRQDACRFSVGLKCSNRVSDQRIVAASGLGFKAQLVFLTFWLNGSSIVTSLLAGLWACEPVSLVC
jgi:hypothetical protein